MMKKSTWKKLFTRSKSKSATRAAKKGKVSMAACNVCAGIAVINVDTLCSSHKSHQNKNQSSVSPQSAVSTGQSSPSRSQTSSSIPDARGAEPTSTVSPQPTATASPQPITAASPTQEEPELDSPESSPPIELSKPQPLVRTSTNEEFMTDEVDSHNLSDNSRTEENLEPVNKTQEDNTETPHRIEFRIPSSTQELRNSAVTEDLKAPSGNTSLRTLENDISAKYPERRTSSETYEAPSVQRAVTVQSSTINEIESKAPECNNVTEDCIVLPVDIQEEPRNVEAKNRKNMMSAPEVDSGSKVGSGRQVSSTNNKTMSEDFVVCSGASAEGEEQHHPKSSRRVSSAIDIPKHDTPNSSRHDSIVTSSHGIQIVEFEDQERPAQRSRRASMDATNISSFESNKSPIFIESVSKESSEDLKPGVLQAQRSSKLNISFSEHVSQLEETAKVMDHVFPHDSVESSEDATEVTIIETTTIIATETTESPLRLGMPSAALSMKTSSGTESEEALLPPPEDDDPAMEADSGTGSDESNGYGPKETSEEISIQQSPANNARPSPTIIFGSMSSPEPTDNEWSQPLFFGPNSLSQGLTLNIDGRDPENARGSEGRAPLQGFGIISIVRDLYENNSSASQVQEGKVTEISEEQKKEDETGESGQAPPSLEDEEAEPTSFKEILRKEE